MPVEGLRYVAFSHVEADECGALNEWLAVAPRGEVVCSRIAAMVSFGDLADRAPLDHFAHAPDTGAILEKLARERPTTLACMHGSAWRGDGAQLLRALAQRLNGAHASAADRRERVGLAA